MTAGSIGIRQAQLDARFFQHRFAGQLNAIAFDAQHLDQNLVAIVQLVRNFVNAMLGNFADVQQTVCSREDFDERAEFRQANYLAKVCLANLRHCGQVADGFNCAPQTVCI
jgi:hypothetical protein